MSPEPCISAEAAAQFLGVPRRFLLSLARKGIAGSYAIGTGDFRKRWIFRLSELARAVDPARFSHPKNNPQGYDPNQGSPR
jgi:hypothetical protein